MIVIPTVEIRNGTSAPSAASGLHAPGDDPVSVAREWERAGFSRLHVVDLDAVNGVGSNADVLDDVIRESEGEVQACGGLQSTEGVQRLIQAGATRVVVGTRAIVEPDWFASVAEMNPGVLVLEATLRDRRVVVRGWGRGLPIDIFDVIEDLDGVPMAGLLVSGPHTDGVRDTSGLNLIEDIAEASACPVMALGGVQTLNDLRALEHRGVSAVVLTSAVLTGMLDSRAVAQEFGI